MKITTHEITSFTFYLYWRLCTSMLRSVHYFYFYSFKVLVVYLRGGIMLSPSHSYLLVFAVKTRDYMPKFKYEND